jgi:hypothetical protein
MSGPHASSGRRQGNHVSATKFQLWLVKRSFPMVRPRVPLA